MASSTEVWTVWSMETWEAMRRMTVPSDAPYFMADTPEDGQTEWARTLRDGTDREKHLVRMADDIQAAAQGLLHRLSKTPDARDWAEREELRAALQAYARWEIGEGDGILD